MTSPTNSSARCVYEKTGRARRRLLHARVAAALSGPRPDGESAALVAQHLRLAGDNARAAEHYRVAAEHAASLHAHANALDQLEQALALGYPDAAEVHERIGDLRTLLGDYGGALVGYETAAALCEPRHSRRSSTRSAACTSAGASGSAPRRVSSRLSTRHQARTAGCARGSRRTWA